MELSFWEAAKSGDLQKLQELYDVSPELISVEKEDITPFYISAVRGHLDCAKFIHEKDPQQFSRKNPLYHTLEVGRLKMAEFVYNLDPTEIQKLNKGKTMEYRVLEWSPLRSLQFVLEKDPSQLTTPCDGVSLLDLAKVTNQKDYVEFLEAKLLKKCPTCRTKTKFHKLYFSVRSIECPICCCIPDDNAYTSSCGHLICGSCVQQLP